MKKKKDACEHRVKIDAFGGKYTLCLYLRNFKEEPIVKNSYDALNISIFNKYKNLIIMIGIIGPFLISYLRGPPLWYIRIRGVLRNQVRGGGGKKVSGIFFFIYLFLYFKKKKAK